MTGYLTVTALEHWMVKQRQPGRVGLRWAYVSHKRDPISIEAPVHVTSFMCAHLVNWFARCCSYASNSTLSTAGNCVLWLSLKDKRLTELSISEWLFSRSYISNVTKEPVSPSRHLVGKWSLASTAYDAMLGTYSWTQELTEPMQVNTHRRSGPRGHIQGCKASSQLLPCEPTVARYSNFSREARNLHFMWSILTLFVGS